MIYNCSISAITSILLSETVSSLLLQFSSIKKQDKHRFTFFTIFLSFAKNSTEKYENSAFYLHYPFTFSKKKLTF